LQLYTSSVAQTRQAGARLAKTAKAGDVYILDGDLGTGKTEFVRGFTDSLGGNATVRSPSFSILNIYQTGCIDVYHFDFYRLSDISELEELGFDDYIYGNGVCLIEWGSLFRDYLPPEARTIRFSDRGECQRVLDADFDF
jgi:tRNA threonylcarbamoyladenosine biosynthesis protein TsaE